MARRRRSTTWPSSTSSRANLIAPLRCCADAVQVLQDIGAVAEEAAGRCNLAVVLHQALGQTPRPLNKSRVPSPPPTLSTPAGCRWHHPRPTPGAPPAASGHPAIWPTTPQAFLTPPFRPLAIHSHSAINHSPIHNSQLQFTQSQEPPMPRRTTPPAETRSEPYRHPEADSPLGPRSARRPSSARRSRPRPTATTPPCRRRWTGTDRTRHASRVRR